MERKQQKEIIQIKNPVFFCGILSMALTSDSSLFAFA